MAVFPYFIAFMAMACYAVMGPLAKKVGTEIQPFSFMAIASLFLAVISIAMTYFYERETLSGAFTKINWSWMVIYIVANFISYAGYLWAIGRIPVAQFEMFGIFVPVIGGFFAWLILKEPFHARYVAALAFMAVGIFIAVGPELKAK